MRQNLDEPFPSTNESGARTTLFGIATRIAIAAGLFVLAFFSEIAIFHAPSPVFDYMSHSVRLFIVPVVVVASLYQAVRFQWFASTYRFNFYTLFGGAAVAAITPAILTFAMKPFFRTLLSAMPSIQPPNIHATTLETLAFGTGFLLAAIVIIASECVINCFLGHRDRCRVSVA